MGNCSLKIEEDEVFNVCRGSNCNKIIYYTDVEFQYKKKGGVA